MDWEERKRQDRRAVDESDRLLNVVDAHGLLRIPINIDPREESMA